MSLRTLISNITSIISSGFYFDLEKYFEKYFPDEKSFLRHDPPEFRRISPYILKRLPPNKIRYIQKIRTLRRIKNDPCRPRISHQM